MEDRSERRTKLAYDTFRKGFGDLEIAPKPWGELADWMRDAIRVAYLQGTLDGKALNQQLGEKNE